MTSYNIRLLILPLLLLLLTGVTACHSSGTTGSEATTDSVTPAPVAFDVDTAMKHLTAQCDFGPRVPNSTAHRRCGDYIAAHFRHYGLQVTEQRTTLTGWDGRRLECRNIIAAYRPEASERVVIAAHWDSRPWANEDPDSTKHNTPVPAANDGASGVAVLLELARLVDSLSPAVGVDFICFDLEDYGAPDPDKGADDGSDWCLGSRYWAEQALQSGYRARYGVLLDMVAGQDARFCYEGFSKRYAEALQQRLWQTAADIGAGHLFLPQDGSYATDDHLPMNEVAGIPTVDIVPYLAESTHSFGITWHTTADTPENISRDNLRWVGQTLLQLLFEEQ